MSFIRFYNADKKLVIKNKQQLLNFIPFIFSGENKLLDSLSIISCSDDYLLDLNKQFLDHDYFTDILTFDLRKEEEIVGEIYISIDRVKENSLVHGVTFLDEFCRILFHGILHLCGYLDKTAVEKRQMTHKEDFYLNEFSTFHVKQN